MGIWTQLCSRSHPILQAGVAGLVYLAALSGFGKDPQHLPVYP